MQVGNTENACVKHGQHKWETRSPQVGNTTSARGKHEQHKWETRGSRETRGALDDGSVSARMRHVYIPMTRLVSWDQRKFRGRPCFTRSAPHVWVRTCSKRSTLFLSIFWCMMSIPNNKNCSTGIAWARSPSHSKSDEHLAKGFFNPTSRARISYSGAALRQGFAFWVR